MTTAYPSALDAYGDPTGGQVQGSTTPTHSAHHKNHNDAVEAIEAKLGTGASTAAANTVLRGTGAGATSFGQVQTADIVANAVTVKHVSVGAFATAYSTGATPLLIADMALTITTDGTVPYLIGFSGSFLASTVSAYLVFDLYVNGTSDGRNRRQCLTPVAGHALFVGFTYLWTPPTSGTYGIEMWFWATAGTIETVSTQRILWATKLLR